MGAEKLNQPFLLEVPIDNPAAEKRAEGPQNCLSEILRELVDGEDGQPRPGALAEVERGTGIPMSTLYDWYKGKTRWQALDKNIPKLAKFFGVSIEYLAYGIGEDSK